MSLPTLRLVIFGLISIVMIALETIWPARAKQGKVWMRWAHHGGLLLVATIAIRAMLPLGALGIAAWAKQEQNWGLFYQTQWPLWLEGLLVVVCMDFLIYLQHVAFHQFGYLWRLHQVHHTDTHLDTSTGIRFHPLEIGISLLYKGICIILLGASLEAVFVFEVLLNGFSLWSHANIDVRSKLDRVLRALWVTPNMHRIHHSVDPRETHQNFGFCLSIWDRVCKTYKSDFEVEGTDLGLPTHRDAKEQKIFKLLVQPWRH